MQRFYFSKFGEKKIIIFKKNDEIFHQITKVLRWKIWDELIFFDWKNYFDYLFFIDEITKNEIILKFKEKIIKNNLSSKNFELNLYQAIPNKQEKIEFILQKWSEIWYSNFYFYKSERSQKFNLTLNKIQRFKKIIIEAIEQSWRNIVPQIYFLDKLDLKNIRWNNYFFHTDSNSSKLLKNLDTKNWKINLFIWPEWWFSEKEKIEFEDNNFSKIYLWDYILRTETVWIVVGFFINQK